MLSRRELIAALPAAALSSTSPRGSITRHARHRPLAITMWDFSWLERRWPGAGYEDWDQALSELKARGYDAVRLDAYPHFLHFGAEKTWELLPQWTVQDWGAASRCRVQVQPALLDFLRALKRHGLCAGLSTWFRQDIDDTRMKITSPAILGEIWATTLTSIKQAGLGDVLLYVDLCNEWPLDVWAPFYPSKTRRSSPEGVRWMKEAVDVVRAAHPEFDYTFSFTSEYDDWEKQDVSMLDFLEPHLWMTHFSDFYKIVGYNYERFDNKGYDNLALKGKDTYLARREHWQERLKYGVDLLEKWSLAAKKPLITTECWSVVDYKDDPMLEWDWIKELCEVGVRAAAAKGVWVAIATSNFCGPQFAGMWRDVAWHRRMTGIIHSARLPAFV